MNNTSNSSTTTTVPGFSARNASSTHTRDIEIQATIDSGPGSDDNGDNNLIYILVPLLSLLVLVSIAFVSYAVYRKKRNQRRLHLVPMYHIDGEEGAEWESQTSPGTDGVKIQVKDPTAESAVPDLQDKMNNLLESPQA